jgi:hypothetical protein
MSLTDYATSQSFLHPVLDFWESGKRDVHEYVFPYDITRTCRHQEINLDFVVYV